LNGKIPDARALFLVKKQKKRMVEEKEERVTNPKRWSRSFITAKVIGSPPENGGGRGARRQETKEELKEH